MRYIWLTDTETGKDFVAPLEKIGAICAMKNGDTVVYIDGVDFTVKQDIPTVLDRIKTVRKKTAPKGKKVEERASDIVLGSVVFSSGMKMFIENNGYGLVLRVFDPDSSYNCSSSGISVSDLEQIKTVIDKITEIKMIQETVHADI